MYCAVNLLTVVGKREVLKGLMKDFLKREDTYY